MPEVRLYLAGRRKTEEASVSGAVSKRRKVVGKVKKVIEGQVV